MSIHNVFYFKEYMISKRSSVVAILFLICALISILWLFNWQSDRSMSLNKGSTAIGLGISYVSINQLSLLDDNGKSISGVVITDIVPKSPADLAGLEVGDVLLSFNGMTIGDENPLFGLIKKYCEAKDIELEIIRNKVVRSIKLNLSKVPE
jgi:predicted metalloprotease with PDZ domain